MRLTLAIVIVAVLTLVAIAHAEETVVQTKVNSVGLFKNGLCVIERSLDVEGGGTYRIEDVPTPIHGTFFIESASPVTAKVAEMLVDAPLDLAGQPLQDQLAGRTVEIAIKDQPAPVSGKVTAVPPAERAWSRQFNQPQYYYDGWGRAIPQPGGNRFIVLETQGGSVLVDQQQITSIKISGDAKTAKKRKPVLLLTLPDASPKQKVLISYLSNGLAWAPSYRVDLVDEKGLKIGQNAIVKNELMDLKDVEVFLISGFPSIDFAHVTSPLSLQQNWSAFFQQLSNRPRPGGGAVVAQQRAVMMNSLNHAMDGGPAAAPPDESIDVHYESIGRQNLAEGEALSLTVGDGKADYTRIVEWIIPDTRDANGRFVQEHVRQQDPEKYDDSPWDAVKFKNPLDFAMTTAPATFMKDGKFMGQQLSRWVNRGEETTLRVTKALSIRTRALESEDPTADRNKLVYIGGNDFRKVSAKGELTIRNFRKTDATVVIKRQFSGEIVEADEKPEVTLREEGIWSVNRRNEAKWTITLKAGEEKTLKYAYTVLVDN